MRGNLVRRHAAGCQFFGRDRVRGDFVRRDRAGHQQLGCNAPAGDLFSRNAVRFNFPGSNALRLEILTADRTGAQGPACYRPTLDVIGSNPGRNLFLSEGALGIPPQNRVEGVARQLDGCVDPQRAVFHQHPFTRRRIHQRRVGFVFVRVRKVLPVHFQRDGGFIAFVNIEPVVRRLPHPGIYGVLIQFNLAAVFLLFLLADLEARVQRFRPDIRNRPDGVDIFFRQEQCAAVLPLRDGIDPCYQIGYVPVPFHGLQVRSVGDPVFGVRFAFPDDIHVQVVPDDMPAGFIQEAGLRVQDGRLRVLPGEVPGDQRIFPGQVGFQFARVASFHGAPDKHQRRCRRRPADIAVAQQGPPKLIADMLRVDCQQLSIGGFCNLTDGKTLLPDALGRHRARIRFRQVRALADFNKSLMPGYVSGFHISVAEVAGFNDHIPGIQVGDDLAAGDRSPRNLAPSVRIVVRGHGRIDIDDVVAGLVVLFVVAYFGACHIFLAIAPFAVFDRGHYRHGLVQRHVALSAGHFPVADGPQRNRWDFLSRHRAPDDHAVIDIDHRVIRHGHVHIISAVVLIGYRCLTGRQRDPVFGKIGRTLRVQFNQSVSPLLTDNGNGESPSVW